LNPVPLVAYPPGKIGQLTDGRLADLAPTVLGLLGVAQPAAMTGRDLTRVS
jgi:2,3-bisphosphoglycerate-independent phosphoglycerate mutase